MKYPLRFHWFDVAGKSILSDCVIKEEGRAFDVALQTPNAVIRDIYYQYYANYLNLTTRETRTAIADIGFSILL